MENGSLQQYKDALLKSKKEIEEELHTLDRVDFGDERTDPDEETYDSEERQKNLALEVVLKSRLQNVDRALEKIGKGTYGICERSEEHTSELQSQFHLVCRLLLEKNSTRRASGQTRSPKTPAPSSTWGPPSSRTPTPPGPSPASSPWAAPASSSFFVFSAAGPPPSPAPPPPPPARLA